MAYIFMYQVEPKAPGKRKVSVPGKEEMRYYDNAGHFIQPLHGHARRKCMGENCKSVLRTVLHMWCGTVCALFLILAQEKMRMHLYVDLSIFKAIFYVFGAFTDLYFQGCVCELVMWLWK